MAEALAVNKEDSKCIVIFYPHIGEYGGIERNIIGLATEIIAMGFQPILLCYYDRINISKYAGFNIPTIIIEDHWNPFLKAYRLRLWYKKNSKSIHGLPFLFGAKAGYYAVLAFIPKYALHYTDPPSLVQNNLVINNPLKKLLTSTRALVSELIIKNGVKNASICITMTNRNADELASIYKRQFEIVYQGGVPQVLNRAKGIKCQSRKLSLFSICRIETSKNLDWLIFALMSLKNDLTISSFYDKITVTIAGKGSDLDRLKALVKQYDLQHDVLFPGFLDNNSVENMYNDADIFLVPGVQGYGLPVLEALYRATPVVLNEASRISEILLSNPWAAVSDNSLESFINHIVSHIQFLRASNPSADHLGNLPTEAIWAEKIGRLCNWW